MSTNTADKPSLESQLDADLPEGVAPPDLVRNMAIIKKRLIEAEAKLAEVAVREKADEDAKKKAREDYAILHGPRAEEITAHMKEIAKEIGGVAALSKEWEEMNKQILTLPDPLSQEMQSVQVSASNGFRKLKAELAARDARIAELEAGALEAAAMAHIDPGEDERLERRELKARGRTAAGGGGMMTPAQGVPERDIPDWAREFNQRAGVGNAYVPPSQRETRGVTARMSTPAPAQAPATRPIPQKRQPQQQQQQPKQQQQQQQQQRSVPWAHRTKNSMRNDHESGEFWGFLADVTPNTDFAKGAMAPLQGMSIVPRQEGSHY